MNRPLWQILFALSFAAFAVQRAIVGHLLLAGGAHPALAVTWAFVLLFAAATAVGVWIERSWAVTALVGTGALLAAAALQQVWLGALPVAAATAETVIVVLVTAALALALRHGERHPANEPVERERSVRGSRESYDDRRSVTRL